MNGRVIGTVLGASGTFLWFMPFVSLGGGYYQAGNHIGGIAYLLLASCVGYSALSWLKQDLPRVVAAGLAMAVCGLFVFQAGFACLWGLVALSVVAVLSLGFGVYDLKASRTAVVAQPQNAWDQSSRGRGTQGHGVLVPRSR